MEIFISTVIIAVVVLVLICLLMILLSYMYRHKGTYLTNEAKGSECAETADVALRADPALHDAVDENKKEYFIWCTLQFQEIWIWIWCLN